MLGLHGQFYPCPVDRIGGHAIRGFSFSDFTRAKYIAPILDSGENQWRAFVCAPFAVMILRNRLLNYAAQARPFENGNNPMSTIEKPTTDTSPIETSAPAPARNEFLQHADEAQPGLVREFWDFLRFN